MVEQIDTNEEFNFKKYVPFMGRDYNIFMLAGLTLTSIFEARHSQVKHLGLTPTEFHLLMLVSELGGTATPGEIAQWMMRKPPTVSGLLNRMERNGLIKRTGVKNNRKLKKVALTSKGQQCLDSLADEQDILNTIISSLTQEEYQQLWSLLEKLRESALSLAGREKVAEED
ncbi:MAG: MarR family transcriptional regulator [Dehalococcoidia bacterium]